MGKRKQAAKAARAAARAAQPTLARNGAPSGYNAAAVSRLRDQWVTRFNSADTEIFGEARTLRDKSRHLVRNNPFAALAVERLASNIVGEGIAPRPDTGDRAKDAKVRKAFARWARRCDHSGQLDFYGMQTLLVREMLEGGEALIRKRLRKVNRKVAGDIPLELQLLEADFLDPYRNGRLGDGTITIQGVTIATDSQKRVDYWLYPQHPGNLWINSGEPMVSAPVPADEVLHVYEHQRTQTRGVPWGTPAIENITLLAEYELAEIVRKRTEACLAAFVINAEDEFDEHIAPPGQVNDEGVDVGGAMSVTDYDGKLFEKLEPGMVGYLRGGKDVRLTAPQAVGGYGEYKASQLHTIAAGFRIPYELLGDLSQVNFSSMRGGLVEFRRAIRRVQRQILIQLALHPIWEWWCETAYLVGEIDDPEVPVIWGLPKFEWVDPKADVDSSTAEVRSGFRSWQDVVAETGRDPDDVLAEIRAFNDKVDEYGIVLDSDPRRVADTGVQQPSEYQDDEADDGDGAAKPAPKRGPAKHGGRAAGAAPAGPPRRGGPA